MRLQVFFSAALVSDFFSDFINSFFFAILKYYESAGLSLFFLVEGLLGTAPWPCATRPMEDLGIKTINLMFQSYGGRHHQTTPVVLRDYQSHMLWF